MRLPDYLQAELDRCPFPWGVVRRSKHWVLEVAGRRAVTLHEGAARAPRREQQNNLSALRRAIRAAHEEKRA